MNQSTHNTIEAIETALREAGALEFSGDVQLLEWAKSTSRDVPKIKFGLLDDESIEPFEMATIRKGKTAGQLYHIFAIRIDEDASQKEVVPASETQQGSQSEGDLPSQNASSCPAPKGGALCKLAAMWCTTKEFQEWAGVENERLAAEFIRSVCDIKSRRELDHNEEAAKLFHELIRIPYSEWLGERG